MFTNWLTPTIATNAPHPDVILEIGPPPYSRFAAHSALLAAHSGYLRSAIRPDDRHIESPIYLPNITTEQFAPLLTYMYTGFLDLNMENIFGVLLATHILHMPRALEICRLFLTRTQPDGYFGNSFFATSMLDKPVLPPIENGVKIIRPIASKATGHSLGFVAPASANKLLPSLDTPFKSISIPPLIKQLPKAEQNDRQSSPIPSTSKSPAINDANESQTLNLMGKKSSRPHKRPHSDCKLKVKSTRNSCESEKIVASEPQTIDECNKVIIDVASCDGPIRFQRVLNDAYGRIPVGARNATASRPTERTNENVANSFHIQMARTISERQTMSSNESENSQEIVVHEQATTVAAAAAAASSSTSSTTTTSSSSSSATNNINNKSEELYSCVYCKHTFKSQYCYQKHAKRHINPLSIDGERVVETIELNIEKEEKNSKLLKASKREVRPLDMNVQYYPCKTCGSKFPSYYFVHKHRKLCHTNEEN